MSLFIATVFRGGRILATRPLSKIFLSEDKPKPQKQKHSPLLETSINRCKTQNKDAGLEWNSSDRKIEKPVGKSGEERMSEK